MPADITAVRDHLFAVLEGLKSGKMDIDKARAINDTAQTIVNTAKVEIDFIRATNAVSASGFFPSIQPSVPRIKPMGSTATPAFPNDDERTGSGIKHVEPIGAAATLTTHRMR